MAQQTPNSHARIDTSALLMIVVGAHLRAEMGDRPLAYRLCENINSWLEHHEEKLHISLRPVICCDVWYLNQPPLQRRPTISLGGPGVNALSAFFNRQLDVAFVSDEQVVIQLDVEFVDLRVCLWGVNHDLTESALDLFERRHLDHYLRAVATQVEPEHH